jgi:hypothetical protein
MTLDFVAAMVLTLTVSKVGHARRQEGREMSRSNCLPLLLKQSTTIVRIHKSTLGSGDELALPHDIEFHRVR